MQDDLGREPMAGGEGLPEEEEPWSAGRVECKRPRCPAASLRLRMTDETITTTGIAAHGASRLPWVEIDSFNLELKDEEGFLGDRASKAAFRETLEEWRKPLRKSGDDPFGKELSENITKKELDATLVGDDSEASAVVHSAVEDFAQELAHVTRRFLKTKAWD